MNRLGDARQHAIVPDRRVLPARRARARELGGHLGRHRHADGRRALLRRDGGARADERRTRAGSARARARGARRRAGAARRLARAALPAARDASRRSARSTWSRSRRRSTSIRACARTTPPTRAQLVDLFGAPERWASTTTSIVWARVETLLPSFTSETEFTLVVPCTYDLEVTSAKYLDALPDGEVPLSFHFSGRIFYRGEDGRLQIVLTPWTSATLPHAGRGLAAHDRPPLPGQRLHPAAGRHAAGAGAAPGDGRASRRSTARSPTCSDGPSRDRRARRLAALRGLRALPVHARSRQERDPHPVRHRLPGRLRARLRPPAGAGAGARRRPAGRGRRSASCRRAASATRRSSDASRSA